jgi:UDP-N-acetylglucosamine 4-epimerase
MSEPRSRYDALKDDLRREPRRWLVTGGAGFIGSHLVEELLGLGQTVRVLDNLATGKRANVDLVLAAAGADAAQRFSFIEGDIADAATAARACEGVDYVLHQAALGSVPRSIADPRASHRANVDGFLEMLIAARDAGVKRFVYASSSSVYGDEPNLPKVESRVGRVLSPYAGTKAVNELYAGFFQLTYGLECVGLRYFNVFGPRQDPDGPYAAVIPKWVKALLQGEPCCSATSRRTTCVKGSAKRSPGTRRSTAADARVARRGAAQIWIAPIFGRW